MFKINLLLTLLFLSTNSFAQQRNIYSASAKGLNPSSYRIGIHGLYSVTLNRFGTTGEKVSLNGEESYSLMEGDMSLAYGVGKKLDAFLNAKMRQVSSQYSNGTTTIKTTNSGLESFSGGMKYSFDANQSIQWAVDFIYRQSTYEQKFFTTLAQVPDSDIILGDAGQEFSFGIHTSYKRKRGHILNSVIRYVVPANDLSDELNYRFESAWLWQKLGIILGVDGIMSFKKDNFTADPQNKPFQATGASARFNSINRERLTPFVGLNWAFKKWRLELEGGQTMKGVSTDQDQYFKFGIVYETSGVTGEDFKIESFKEYIIDSTVIKVSPRGKFLKIDQGISSDVEKGMKFDIFQTDYFGENILVASGLAYEVKADTAIIKVIKKYKKIKLKKGFAGRGY